MWSKLTKERVGLNKEEECERSSLLFQNKVCKQTQDFGFEHVHFGVPIKSPSGDELRKLDE